MSYSFCLKELVIFEVFEQAWLTWLAPARAFLERQIALISVQIFCLPGWINMFEDRLCLYMYDSLKPLGYAEML